jgi:excinuclease ABC subunit C
VNEGEPLPDLLITDGGKGQMEVVRQVVEDELHLQIPIAGLAKNDRHRTSELLYGFPPVTVGLKQTSPLFHLLERIQDEVHRFAITFHRNQRSKSQVASALDAIPGVGAKRKQDLLKAFKSVARIRQAKEEDIAKVVGAKTARKIVESLNKEKEKEP